MSKGGPDNLGKYYILDKDHRVIPATAQEWSIFFSDFEKNRRVAETITSLYRVSTVFLGLDHQWGKGPPIVFETMAFELAETEVQFSDGSKFITHEDFETARYSSWDDAITGHRAMVRRIKRMEAEAAASGALALIKGAVHD